MVSTREVVVGFMRANLERRGHYWEPPNKETGKSKPDKSKKNSNNHHNNQGNSAKEVSEIITRITNEMRKFIRQNKEDIFNEMVEKLVDPEHFYIEGFRCLADELFADEFNWNHIVAFFLFCLECAVKAIEIAQDETDDRFWEENDDVNNVNQLVDWMCWYIDDNLIGWIEGAPDGWLDIKYFVEEKNDTHTTQPQEKNSRGKKYYGVATVTVFIGALVLLSKFSKSLGE